MSDYLIQGIIELQQKVKQLERELRHLERVKECSDKCINELENDKKEIIQHAHECCDFEMQLELEERLESY